MPDNNAIITAFVREFDVESPDGATLAAYFSEDAVYHNVPLEPVNGKAAIAKVLGGMGQQMKSKGWEVIHQAAAGDVVLNERVDRFDVGGKQVAVKVMGVFELRDGKISAWRDYFDLAQFRSQMS